MNALFVAWRPPQPDTTGWRPIGRLVHEDGIYRFFYTAGARKPGFRPFPGMKDLGQIYESEKLFPIFENRLLSEHRPEYESFLRWSGFDVASPPDPVVILGVTEGRKETDAIEVFPCPRPDEHHCYVNRFFLQGIRWMPKPVADVVNKLQSGDALKIMLDVQNTADSSAVAVRTENERTMIGYVPRYLAHDVYHLFQMCEIDFVELSVKRVNLDAPLQNRVLIEMRACWPNGFEPCSSEDFTPIPANVPERC